MRPIACLLTGSIAAGVWLAAPAARADEPFSYNPPGVLVEGSGEGRFDEQVYAPGMRFPIETGPAYLNSQVWGHGGSMGPGGGQCDPENRQYPWWDNYCETRTWDMPLCPAGEGHQGQDIRAGTCEDDTHWVVAGADGEITSIGSYTVYLTTDDGTRFDYLHMSSVQVQVGDIVKRGDRLGKVSNAFGGTPTTLHLHFNIQQNVAGIGIVFVPPYMSLIASYQELLGEPPEGELAGATCERVRGASRDPDAPDEPTDVRVSVGGAPGEDGVLSFEVTADGPTDELCGDEAAPCARGFEAWLPISLLDGKVRDVRVYALDASDEAEPVELSGSPATVVCDVLSTKDSARRPVGDGAFEAWGFSVVFDQLLLPPADVDALPEAAALPDAPKLVASGDGAALWMLDGDSLRAVSADAASAFRLDPASAEVWSEAERGGVEAGEPWPGRPALVRGEAGALFLLDPGAEIPLDVGVSAGETTVSCACRATRERPSSAIAPLVALALGFGLRRIRRRRARGPTAGSSLG